MDKEVIWRTPTTTRYAASGRNRWVKAYTREAAVQRCKEEFGVYPVEAYPVDKVEVWEREKKK